MLSNQARAGAGPGPGNAKPYQIMPGQARPVVAKQPGQTSRSRARLRLGYRLSHKRGPRKAGTL